MIDWTTMITEAYWPITVLVILFVFRKKISKIVFKNTYGEILVDLNSAKEIVDKKYNKLIKHLDTSDIWFLYDIKLKRMNLVSKMNPVQKFVYKRMIKTPLIERRDDEVFLTDVGEKIIELAQAI